MSKTSYHHGDLANQLISLALRILDHGGPEAVSLRELSAELGVSRSAPYRHFRDREALLAAVAARGFDDLIARYDEAARVDGNPVERLKATCRAYIGFARQNPGLFKLMFESPLLTRSDPPKVLAEPADRAYRLLWEAVAAAYPNGRDAEIKARTICMWSTCYGFLSLSGSHRIREFMVGPLSEEDLEAALIDTSVLGPRPGLAAGEVVRFERTGTHDNLFEE